MANNSPVYWDILTANGSTWFSLHTYAWSVKSFGGRRWVAGAKRGENIMLPHRQGRIYVPKMRESQTYDINMWVFPLEEDGRRPLGKTTEQKAHQNWRKIIDAFDQEDQFYIRKRWHADDSTREDFSNPAEIETAVALAEFMDASGPDSDDGKGFYGSISLSLPDPYFYGNQTVGGLTPAVKAAGRTWLGEGVTAINPAGEAPSTHLLLTFSNVAASNPRVTFPDGNWIEFLGAELGQAGEFVVDCGTGIAVKTDITSYLYGNLSGAMFVNGLVRRNPYFTNWPTINPNKYPTTQIHVSGGGTIGLIYDPAYR